MRCKVGDCFYNDKEFCSIGDIEIDEEGYCSELIILSHADYKKAEVAWCDEMRDDDEYIN